MANRPCHLDLNRSRGNSPPRNHFLTISDMPSPRVGEVPPALSPLDALAMHGRLLAQRFDQEKQKGRRMSRLEPLTVEREFAKVRPTYMRSASNEQETEKREEDVDLTPNSAQEVKREYRPYSIYPQIQNGDDEGPQDEIARHFGQLSTIQEPEEPQDYFGMIPRSHSPEQIIAVEEPTPQVVSPRQGTVRSNRTDSNTSRGGLAPPKSPVHSLRHQGSSNIGSVMDESDFSLGGSMDSLPPMKPSTATSYSRSPSPYSPFQAPTSMPRSPSITSNHSYDARDLPRPTFNFSRPLSRSSQNFSVEVPRYMGQPSPSRQASGESSSTRPSFDIPTRQGSGDSPVTPYSFEFDRSHQVTIADDSDPSYEQQPNSYIYTKYSLPRGKRVDRQSIGPAAFLSQQFAALNPETSSITSSPPRIRDRDVHWTPQVRDDSPTRQSKSSNSSTNMTIRPTILQRSTSELQTNSPKRLEVSHSPRSSMPSLASLPKPDTAAIKAKLERTKTLRTSAELTPEDHLQKGIECHEAGSLQESTYHLRIAAKAGLPTAQLLYALACRHGWGMRPSPAEGVRWLQRAVDSAQLEIASDSDPNNPNHPDVLMQQSHKAQFALSVYELGVSYMNGWGVQKDSALALKCFEVAGTWGDADALAEAGFCYMEGVGCKKDRFKAARYYRMAGEKGVSMAGQSWIYKDKYMQDPPAERSGRAGNKTLNEKKMRDKSRTRTIFGRKKSYAN